MRGGGEEEFRSIGLGLEELDEGERNMARADTTSSHGRQSRTFYFSFKILALFSRHSKQHLIFQTLTCLCIRLPRHGFSSK